MYSRSRRMGAWWNSLDDLKGDVSDIFNAAKGAQGIVNQAANTIAHYTQPVSVIPSSWLTYGAIAIGGFVLYEAVSGRRRNPAGRRRRRR